MSGRRDRRIRRYIFRGIVGVAIAMLIGFGAWYGFKLVRKQKAMAMAREFADRKEFFQAALAARRALQLSPNDLAANRMMAEMADAVQTKEAVTWRKTIAEMQPGVARNYLDWAESALRFRDGASAREALSHLDAAAKDTAAYHDIAARLAVLTGQTSQVYAHVAAAAQLEPHNENYQLQFGALQLGSPLAEIRKGAVAKIEQLTEGPGIRRQALRLLIQSAMSEGDGPRTLRYAVDLMNGPDGTFEDRMLYLKLLGKLKRPEYWWFLAQLGAALPDSDEELVTLLSWMNNNRLSRLTLKWTDELPAQRSERVPVCVAIGEAHALLGNWGKLKSLLRYQKWGDLEFQREALTARVAREEGDDIGATSHWAAAVTLAADRSTALSALGRFAVAWKWEKEYTSLCWTIANGRSQQASALHQLLQKYTAEARTRDILRVYTRMLDLDPENLNLKNNVAYALMILNMETERAQVLAYEVRNSEPKNPDFSATYALALHTKGKTEAGLKILQQIPEIDRKVPSTALCFGVLYAAKGMKDEARAYLDIAEKGNLLPEERTMISKARDKLRTEPAPRPPA